VTPQGPTHYPTSNPRPLDLPSTEHGTHAIEWQVEAALSAGGATTRCGYLPHWRAKSVLRATLTNGI